MTCDCPECGKHFYVLYPDLWVYKRGDYLCSYHCMRKFDRQKGINEAMKLKKDGTPAKKPGPKSKEQTISEVDVCAVIGAETPDVKEEPKHEMLDVCAVKSRVLNSGRYELIRIGCDGMMLKYDAVSEYALTLNKENWIALSEEILIALKQLGIAD